MTTDKSRPLHLHTLETLCADLVAGLAVEVDSDGSEFQLQSDAARGVLAWYGKNRPKWSGNVQTTDVEAIVDASSMVPPSSGSAGQPSGTGPARRFTLTSMRAHQFAGLHHAGTSKSKPEDLIVEFTPGVTLFEGYNGCGKTSLLNALIWALTGEVLRPQRAPESGNKDFDFEVGETSKHSAPPVVPLPDPSLEPLAASAIPVDTWVQLSFVDQDGAPYQVRRSLTRGPRGTLKEEFVGLDALGLDPISTHVGTTMAGLVPYVQVGSTSALGKAVSELTGMAPLVQLASHATRAKKKIDTDLIKSKVADIASVDEAFTRSRDDYAELVRRHALDTAGLDVPISSSNPTIEECLSKLQGRLDELKNSGLNLAKKVLGDGFDAQVESQRADLVTSIAPALNTLAKLGSLPSMQRLGGLTKLTETEAAPVRKFIEEMRAESLKLTEIASEPTKAARVRLYSRVAAWIREHSTIAHDEDSCAVCGQSLVDVVDGVTGLSVKAHLGGAAKEADFAGKSFATWAQHAIGELSRLLPPAIGAEARNDLKGGPTTLLRQAIEIELFADDAFARALKPLKASTANSAAQALAAFPAWMETESTPIGEGRSEFRELNRLIDRVEQLLSFPAWRKAANVGVTTFMREVVGKASTSEQETAPQSLMGQLLQLQSMVAAIEPIDEASTKLTRMVTDIHKRRGMESRLVAYGAASLALQGCISVGDLAERQVTLLEKRLHGSSSEWRKRIYLGAFPSTNLDLVKTKMSGSGDLQLMVGASGLAAPAQHISNASALRASLLGFYLAYWQYMLEQRGGLRLLLLDDPQELLDGDNRERLADAVNDISRADAQLVITTHDTRYAASVARRTQAKSIALNHVYVHPATVRRGTIYLTPSIAKVQAALEKFNADPDDAAAAQDYAAECRVFLEGRMGDLFDSGAYPAAATVNFAPTLMDHIGRLRGLVGAAPNDLFRSPVIIKFMRDAALKDGAPAVALLNKAHHRDKGAIRPAEVVAVKEDLERLRQLVERAHEEFRTFTRREPLAPPQGALLPLIPAAAPNFRIPVVASLKAFVRDASIGESQETEVEEITGDWFNLKAFFYIRSNTLGFAGPQSSVAIVDVEAAAATDRQLVIARTGKETYARRLLRPRQSDHVALAAEPPDPRRSPPTELMPEKQVSLHPIVGMLFAEPLVAPPSKHEAVQLSEAPQIRRVRTAYRIKEESAVPLALPGQIALGGDAIPLNAFDSHLDQYVALHLDDGTNLFKRVGNRLPPPLQHLRQFETIGGLGVADILAVDGTHEGFRSVLHAVAVIGVLYGQ